LKNYVSFSFFFFTRVIDGEDTGGYAKNWKCTAYQPVVSAWISDLVMLSSRRTGVFSDCDVCNLRGSFFDFVWGFKR